MANLYRLYTREGKQFAMISLSALLLFALTTFALGLNAHQLSNSLLRESALGSMALYGRPGSTRTANG